MTDPVPPTSPARRRLLAVAALAGVCWAGLAGYAAWWKFYGEWDKAEVLSARRLAGERLTDAEFDWALARVRRDHAAVARHARLAVGGDATRGAKLEATFGPDLDHKDSYTRTRAVLDLMSVALARPPADPLRARVLAAALGLLDDASANNRTRAVHAVGLLGTAEHLPKVRAVWDGAADPLEKRLAGEAADRLGGKP